MLAVKMRGGFAMVQDPVDALCPSMPRSVIDHVEVDRVVPIAEMAGALVQAVNAPVAGPELARPEPMRVVPPLPEQDRWWERQGRMRGTTRRGSLPA